MQRRYIAGLAAVALVCASAPARAQQTQRTHHIRSYTNTLQLHSAPQNILSPEMAEKEGETAEQLDRRDGIPTTPVLLNSGGAASRTPTRIDKKKKDKNWITAANEKKDVFGEDERKPSGWGWLADDVRDQQDDKDRKKDGEEDAEAEDDAGERSDESLAETVIRKSGESDRRSEAASTYSPVDAEKLLKDVGPVRTARDPASTERDAAAPRAAAPQAAAPERAPAVTDTRSGADTMWNADKSWGPRTEPAPTLPLTSRMLSDPARSSPGTLSQPAFSPSTYQGPTPGSFLTKSPLQAAPSPAAASPSAFPASPGLSTPAAGSGMGGFGLSPAGATAIPVQPIKPLQPSQPLNDSFYK